MPSIGARIHELRVDDTESRVTWRIVYRIDSDAIVVTEVFAKKSRQTPQSVIEICKKRYREYDQTAKGD